MSLDVDVEPDTTLLAAAHLAGIPLRNDCGGTGQCGKCAVYITENSGPFDRSTAKKVFACREKVAGRNLSVFVPEESLLHQSAQIVAHSGQGAGNGSFCLNRLTIVPLDLTPPTREDHRSDLARLREKVSSPLELSLAQLQSLPNKLRKADWKGAALFLEGDFLDFFDRAESQKTCYAVALDIGTTMLAAELVPLTETPDSESYHAVRVNPQKIFGDDIISRIQKVIDDTNNLERLRDTILEASGQMIRELAEKAKIDTEKILLLTVSGNTVMQQLFLGIDPRPLGFSPFVPATNRYPIILAKELDLPIHPSGRVQTLPILGGFVGGDLVAGILATNMDRLAEGEGAALLIDIGTNGEMILAHENRLYAAATAAGPAFEGARIQFGMIAAEGAIDHVDFRETISIHTIGNGPIKGICGSGLIDLTAELLNSGTINSRGLFAKPDTLPPEIQRRLTNFEGKSAFRLTEENREPAVVLTQKDVRQVQLAAGAIRCGILLLLELAGLKPSEIRSLFLAGGFGNYIRPESAQRIGLFPPEITVDRIRFCGNTSLQGAKLLACDRNTQSRIDAIVERTEHVDLSTRPNFSTLFGESMIFPE